MIQQRVRGLRTVDGPPRVFIRQALQVAGHDLLSMFPAFGRFFKVLASLDAVIFQGLTIFRALASNTAACSRVRAREVCHDCPQKQKMR